MLSRDPQNVQAYYERVYAFLVSDYYVEAIGDFSTVIVLDPDHPWPHAARGLAQTALANYAGAVTDFDSAIRFDPDDNTALANRDWAQFGLLLQHHAATRALLPEENTLVSPDPDAALNYHLRGRAFAALQQFEAALTDYGTALRLDPQRAEVHADRGRVLIALERHEAGLADFQAALNFNPAVAEIYRRRGQILVVLERFEEAIDDYEAALELDAEAAAAYAGRARVKAQLERPMEGIADSTAALELDSNLSGVAELRSELQSQLALLPDATVNFAANLRGGPGTNYPVIGQQFEGYRVKPIVRTADEQWIKLAQGAWIHADLLNDVSLDLAVAQQIPTVPGETTTAPEAPLAVTDYFNQGLDQAKARKYLQAVAAYAQALLVDSENAAVLGRLGVARAFLGEYAEAIEDLNSGIRLAPDNASAYAFRGMSKALQGNYAEAVADLDEAIGMISDPSYVPGPQELSLAHPLEPQTMHGDRLATYVIALRDQVLALSSE